MSARPWEAELAEGDFISTSPSYEPGRWLDRFDEGAFSGLRYYLFDPVRHGAPKDGRYPLLFWLHGAGNALAGKVCVSYSGAERFAGDPFQRLMGGAYVLVPLANEREAADGGLEGHFMTSRPLPRAPRYGLAAQKAVAAMLAEDPSRAALVGTDCAYAPDLLALLDHVQALYPAADRAILFGTSAGGYAGWRLLLDAPNRFAGALLMAAAYLPDEDDLDTIEKCGIPLWLVHGLRDEMVPYAYTIKPNLPRLNAMKNVHLTSLDWVRNGDGGVASIFAGEEMGQHCVNAQAQQNLIYNDGTPYDPACPDGVTGWVRRIAGK